MAAEGGCRRRRRRRRGKTNKKKNEPQQTAGGNSTPEYWARCASSNTTRIRPFRAFDNSRFYFHRCSVPLPFTVYSFAWAAGRSQSGLIRPTKTRERDIEGDTWTQPLSGGLLKQARRTNRARASFFFLRRAGYRCWRRLSCPGDPECN